MTAPTVPTAARVVAQDWRRLAQPTDPIRPFDARAVAALHEPARRWLEHAIAPNTNLATTAQLQMRGQIRLGSWRSFTATQILSPPRGFVWAATARVGGLPISGFDRYSSGAGQMRWRVLGLVPLMSAAGPDVTRSARGRLAAEGITLLPTSYAQVTWTSVDDDPDAVSVSWRVDDCEETVRLQVAADGRLTEVRMERWGNPDGQRYGRFPFGVAVDEERTFDGITIPARLRAGWWWGTERAVEGEFFRAEITAAMFR